MKTRITQQQMDNLVEAATVMWPSVPPENVDPGLVHFTQGYTNETHCRTVACGGGWCARWPAFQAQGIGLNRAGAPFVIDDPDMCPSMYLFGADDALFSPKTLREAGTDHEVFAKRLQALIDNSEVVS